jgi:hypothetical protein
MTRRSYHYFITKSTLDGPYLSGSLKAAPTPQDMVLLTSLLCQSPKHTSQHERQVSKPWDYEIVLTISIPSKYLCSEINYLYTIYNVQSLYGFGLGGISILPIQGRGSKKQ